MIVLDDHDGTRNEAGTWASLGDLGNLSASRDDKTVLNYVIASPSVSSSSQELSAAWLTS